MKNIYKIIAIVLFTLTATLNAQLKNVDGTTNDEYLGKQPVTGGACDCVNNDIANFNFNFSNSFNNAIANDRAVIEAAEREAWDWYEYQTELLKNYIAYHNYKTFDTYDEAKDFIFKKTEFNNIQSNVPLARSKMIDGYNRARHARHSGLKGLKALQFRENEIKAGKLDNSLYPDFKVNNIPLKDIRTLSQLNSIKATTNTTTIEGIWQTPEFFDLQNLMANPNFGELEASAIIKKNSLYNKFNPWDRLNMMQFLIHYEKFKQYSNPPYLLSGEAAEIFDKFNEIVDIATLEFIENEFRKEYTNTNLFHPDYWRIILKDKYNNNGLYTHVAKADHQALMNAELNRLKSQTPIGASLNVDKIVQWFDIRDKNQLEWINANTDKATEFLKRLDDARKLDKQETSEPIPDNEIISVVGENFNSEKYDIKNEIEYGGRIAKLAEELSLNPDHKNWMLTHFEQAIKIVNFADISRINDVLSDAKKIFIIEIIKAYEEGYNFNFDDRIINKLNNECAKTIFSELENGIFENSPLKPEVEIVTPNSIGLNFHESILKLFKDSQKTNLVIKNGTSINSNAQTIKTTITLNDNYLSNATKLSITRTIIHESVHSYLNAVFYSNPDLSNQPLRIKMRSYASEKGFTDLNRFHHEFMAQYIDAMAYSLYEWDKEYGSGKGLNNINKPDDLLGWEYYYSMAFGGLFYEDTNGNLNPTDSFIELVPSENDRTKIIQILENEQNGTNDYKGEKCN
ncbi:hypothetical protein EV195_101305 [Tenacibaculum skagerrakense]|uniref:Uncharacterized protein n=1 Tax=Tenacibaculum skagerrakense TaxID=186571 RepID=A0A4R2P349_9FLAO|nr:hypothetical protein [Tenacibaculum skagerrakense]TCP28145.1 hypothetical protein EV195_101305 [Tenacibaculum skagerrakense]